MSDKYSNFCIAPFTNLLVSPNGKVSVCPKNITELGCTTEESVEKIWNSKEINKIRTTFEKNLKENACRHCWQVEDDGGLSLRQFASQIYFKDNPDQSPESLIEAWKNGALKVDRFEFALSNACNLSCRHCWPISSTGLSAPKFHPAIEVVIVPYTLAEKAKDIFGANESFSDLTFNESIEYVSKNASQISIVGGEPFLDRRIINLLELFSEEDKKRIRLTITSNFSVPEIIKQSVKYLDHFKKIDIVASIDGSRVVTEYIRNGSNANKIQTSVQIVQEYFGDRMNVDRLLLCNYALQAMNLLDLASAIRFIVGELKIQTISLLHVHELHLNVNILPFNLKQLAKKRLMDFIINDFEDLVDEVFHEMYYTNVFNPVIKMCDSEERNAIGWNRFMDYTEKYDQAVGKSIFDAIPEMKNYWFKIEEKY